jgi:hypothetical protein
VVPSMRALLTNSTRGQKYIASVQVRITHTFLFNILFGPFLGAPGAFAHHFRIPLLPLRIPIFSPDFDFFSHFLLQGSLIHLLPGLVNSLLLYLRPSCTNPHLSTSLNILFVDLTPSCTNPLPSTSSSSQYFSCALNSILH